MKSVAVIHKPHTSRAAALAAELSRWLGEKKHASQVFEAAFGDEMQLSPDTNLVVVLGGDGTLLGAVRAMVSAGLSQVPILGVNLGGLGFLTELSPEELTPALELVLKGEYHAPKRLMLKTQVERDGKEIARFTALNDVVINKAALARIVELAVEVDGMPLTTFRADGIIFASPTGSTAYNLSAGGPICHPSLDCIAIAPICPFTLTNRPLLLHPDMALSLALNSMTDSATLTCDGQVGLDLLPHDKVTIKRAETTVRIIHSPFRDYFEVLRTKLSWG